MRGDGEKASHLIVDVDIGKTVCLVQVEAGHGLEQPDHRVLQRGSSGGCAGSLGAAAAGAQASGAPCSTHVHAALTELQLCAAARFNELFNKLLHLAQRQGLLTWGLNMGACEDGCLIRCSSCCCCW